MLPVSPVLDVDIETILEIGKRLMFAVLQTKKEVGWVGMRDAEMSEAESASSMKTEEITV